MRFLIFFKNIRYFSGAYAFASLSILQTCWFISIPYVAKDLALSESELGMAMFFYALGAFAIMLKSSTIVSRFGDGTVTFWSVIGLCLTITLPMLSTSLFSLSFSLFLVGAFCGLLDISMNAMVSTVEKKDDVLIMSGSHGFYSLGGMIGAGIGGIFLANLPEPFIYTAIIAVVIGIGHLLIRGYYYSIRDSDEHPSGAGIKIGPIFFLAAIGFFIMLSEGAVADWSSIYLDRSIEIDAAFIGFGYGGFSLAMALGRFSGDYIGEHVSSNTIIRLGCLLAAVGMYLVTLANPVIVILGFILVGFGFAGIVPVLFRISANMPGVKPSQGVATIAGSGYIGFLIGPVVLGFIADQFSLRQSFIVLLAFTMLSYFIALFALGRRKR